MPSNFVPSFISEEWAENRHLPSSVFRAQIDPRTMLWKDLYEMRDIDMKAEKITDPSHKPCTRPIQTRCGAQIEMIEATGVAIPDSKALDNVKMRAIRVSLVHKPHTRNEVIGNVI